MMSEALKASMRENSRGTFGWNKMPEYPPESHDLSEPEHRHIGRCGHAWDRQWGDDPHWCPACAKARADEKVPLVTEAADRAWNALHDAIPERPGDDYDWGDPGQPHWLEFSGIDGRGAELAYRNAGGDWLVVRMDPYSPTFVTIHMASYNQFPDHARYLGQAQVGRSSTVTCLAAENARLHDALKVRTDERDHYRDECKRLADGPPIAATPSEVARYWMDSERNRHGTQFNDFAHARLSEVIRAARGHGRQRPAPVPDPPKPTHDFTRDFGHDPRRMGPVIPTK